MRPVGQREDETMQGYGYTRIPLPPRRRGDELPGLDASRVLLVEDDAEYGRMVARVLRRATPPLWVHRENRLDAALRRLERGHYDALVVDLKLPDASGRATLEAACALAERLPVLVLTGTDDENLALEAMRAGAEDYLVKQRTHALTLPGAVSRAMERHRRRRSGAPEAPEIEDAGLADEVQLLDHLQSALARATRLRRSVAVLVARYEDVDWLAEAFGREAVERILARAVRRIGGHVRRGDLLARIDGDRLAMVVEGRGEADDLRIVARELRLALGTFETELDEGVEVGGLTAAIGIALLPPEGADPETLLENASQALENASPHGGIQFYEVEPD
jgi:diguanylate cyclase (GGDEF)-like protein